MASGWFPGICYGPDDRAYSLEQVQASVGEGWADLAARGHALVTTAGGCVKQTKEKWGGLVIYFDLPPDVTREAYAALWGALETIEGESRRTCERCGRPGEPTDTA